MVNLSRLLDSNSRAGLGQLRTTAQRLVTALAECSETQTADNDALSSALWDLAEDLSICSEDLRKQLAINAGESDGLFCHWNDTTGMQIWRLLTAIKAAGEAVEDVAYWFTRIHEGEEPEDEP